MSKKESKKGSVRQVSETGALDRTYLPNVNILCSFSDWQEMLEDSS